MKFMTKYFLVFIILLTSYSLSQDNIKGFINIPDSLDEHSKLEFLFQELNKSEIMTQRGMAIAEKGYKLAHQLGNKRKQLEFLQEISFHHRRSGEYDKAIAKHLDMLALTQSLNDSAQIARAYKNLGVDYYFLGDYDKALQNLQEAYELAVMMGDEKLTANILNNIGLVHYKNHNYENSIDYFKDALKMYYALNHKYGQARAHNNVGLNYEAQSKYDSALENYNKALEISRAIPSGDYTAYSLSNIGNLHIEWGNLDKALQNKAKALDYYEEFDIKNGIVEQLIDIGRIKTRQSRYKEADSIFSEGLKIAEEIGSNPLLMNLHKSSLENHRKAGDLKEALKDYDKYTEVKDSIFTEKKNQQISEMQTKFETKQTEKELEIQKLETQKAESFRNYLLIILALIVIILLFVYNRYKVKANANRKIKEREKELEELTEQLKEQKEKLEKSEADLREANSAKDKFISIMAHDIKNPLSTITGLSNLLKEDYEDLSENEKKEYIGSIEQVSNDLIELLQNLLEWAQLQDGRISFEPKNVDLNEVIDKSVKYYLYTAKNKNISINKQVDDNLLVNADPDMLKTILRNLINNSVKFTDSGGEINVRAEKRNGEVKV
jgi:tetratricopeptide (TPR) repeat protein